MGFVGGGCRKSEGRDGGIPDQPRHHGSAPGPSWPRPSAAELATRLEAAQIQADTYTAQAELLAAQERLVVIQKRRSAGVVGDIELLRAQLAVKEREIALQRLAIRPRAAK